MQSNGWPFKSQLLCTVHSALNCGTKGLNMCTLLTVNMWHQTLNNVSEFRTRGRRFYERITTVCDNHTKLSNYHQFWQWGSPFIATHLGPTVTFILIGILMDQESDKEKEKIVGQPGSELQSLHWQGCPDSLHWLRVLYTSKRVSLHSYPAIIKGETNLKTWWSHRSTWRGSSTIFSCVRNTFFTAVGS